jgi:hypothetical protein
MVVVATGAETMTAAIVVMAALVLLYILSD